MLIPTGITAPPVPPVIVKPDGVGVVHAALTNADAAKVGYVVAGLTLLLKVMRLGVPAGVIEIE